MVYNGTTYYYVLNLQGDVIQIVTASGESKADYTYDAWGRVLTATGMLASVNPLRYRGYYYDTETGLYYLQSRYYDPVVKRFINADAYESTGQNFIGYNMFAYCLNLPVSLQDGNASFAVTALVGAVVLGGASGVLGAAASGDNLLIGGIVGAATGAACVIFLQAY